MAERTRDPATPVQAETTEADSRQFPPVGRRGTADAERIRAEFGRVRAYFKQRPAQYRDLQRALNQARSGVGYDVYLERTAYYAILTAVAGGLFGVFLTLLLSNLGVIAGIRNPLAFDGGLVRFVGRNRSLAFGAAVTLVLAVLSGGAVWYARAAYPRYIAGNRRRNIDVTLPHAITFLYALSHGGMSLLETMRGLAEAQDSYGEVANEFDMIVRDVDLFGNDLYTAIRNARNVTPSDNLEGFFDDLLAVLDAGGDVTAFFQDETDTYLEDAREQQGNFVSTLELLSEVFVVGFVAAPLFLVVILLVISLLGGATLGQLTLLIYAILPLGMIAFLVVIDVLSTPYRVPRTELEAEPGIGGDRFGRLAAAVVRDAVADLLDWLGVLSRSVPDEATLPASDRQAYRTQQYRRTRRRQEFRKRLSDPFAFVRRSPLWSLLFTVPLALVVVGVSLATGIVESTPTAFLAEPVTTTTLLFVVPLLIVAIPLSVFHELKARRETDFARRFPDTLNVLSGANRMGIEFTDALAMVGQWSRGPLATELRMVRNDIRWHYDTRAALLGLANRVQAPSLSRTLKLVAEGTRSSSDVARVLAVAADDARERFKIERRRRQDLSAYTTVVVVGFLVYMLVIVLLDTSYLQPIADTPSVPEPEGVTGTPVSVVNLPVEAYRALFFHSALIQATGVGLIAGKLSRDSVLSGLKYGIALIALTLVTFALL
ncbi:type II secretion system F family protein [Halorientalis pallida]|uniref:Pilus assembly protein n=1 Tax=Halorientalis pallida TaxID=2479928 RepID=A0A498L0B9_9EURY|nr:type II secretion system F family protein [Halorientalis pallida]RXK51730.1 pilus assembly protein [Halorientalis pallida]